MPKPLPLLEPVPDAGACCAPLSTGPLSVEDSVELASRLKALADPARLRLLSLLLAAGEEGACTCDVVEPLGLSQPTVSHHLKKLTEAGLVVGERRGVWTYYRALPTALTSLTEVLVGTSPAAR